MSDEQKNITWKMVDDGERTRCGDGALTASCQRSQTITRNRVIKWIHLILVRHGETDANHEGRLMSNSLCPSLNATGRGQATDVATALKTELPFQLYTSPTRRPRETAGIISRTLNSPEASQEWWVELEGVSR